MRSSSRIDSVVLLGLPRVLAAIGVCCWIFAAELSRADTVTVAVAANFAQPLEAIAEGFSSTTGHSVVPVVGATGLLYAQIERGAPFDIFLAADSERPERLISAGLADPSSRFTYALGRLALWLPGSESPPAIESLSPVGGRRLAMANPRLAPYGAAAEQVMRVHGVLERWQGSMVFGQNVGATYALVASGNVDGGFVALSQLLATQQPETSYTVIQTSNHSAIAQDAVLTLQGQSNPAASEFMAYLQSPEARVLIQRAGYGVLNGDAHDD